MLPRDVHRALGASAARSCSAAPSVRPVEQLHHQERRLSRASAPRSVTSTMFSWPIADAARASRRKRSSSSGRCASSGRSSLAASRLPSGRVLDLVDRAHPAGLDVADDDVFIVEPRPRRKRLRRIADHFDPV